MYVCLAYTQIIIYTHIIYTLDAVDYNISQSAILELKIACIKCLTHVEFLELLGEVPSTKRYCQSNTVYVKPHHTLLNWVWLVINNFYYFRVGIFEKVKGLLPDYAKVLFGSHGNSRCYGI